MKIKMKQKVLHWSISSRDGYDNPTFAEAVELYCRWEDISVKFLDKAGNEIVSRAIVYLPSDVSIGDMLALGNSSNLASDTTLPFSASVSAHEVKAFNKIPNVKGDMVLRKAIL